MKGLIKEIETNLVFYFDNASAHQTKLVDETLKEIGICGMSGSPYSPELNMAEKFIKVCKQRIELRLK